MASSEHMANKGTKCARTNRVADAGAVVRPVVSAYLLIADILQRVGHDGNAHVDQVGRSDLEHLFRELLAILVDLLDRHRPHDGTLVAFERHQGDVLDFGFRFAEELLARRQQHVLVLALDLHLRDAGHGDRHALAGVHGRAFHLQRHGVERDSATSGEVSNQTLVQNNSKDKLSIAFVYIYCPPPFGT